jgi:hypothetical protein
MSIFSGIFGKGKPDSSPDFQLLLEQSMEELRLKTVAHESGWCLDKANWAVDQDAGTITFTLPEGVIATCPVQVIGTYNTEDSTWLWGWDHPSVVTPLQEHARTVKAYGQQHGIERLTTQKLSCTEEDAWQFAALACKLCEAQGAYRGPSGPTRVFMTFGTVSLSKSR